MALQPAAPAPRRVASSAPLTPGQSAWLDALRGVSAQLVLVGHALIAFAQPGPVLRTLPHSLGVVVFFLLSGYLITLTTLAKSRGGGYGLADFTIDRAARIFTPYVPALVVVALVDVASSASPAYPFRQDFTLATGVLNLLMLQDHPLFLALRRLGLPDELWIFGPFGSGRPFWTIMIEWWIYLAFGFGLFVLWRDARPRGAARWLIAAGFAIVPLTHLVAGYGQCLTMVWGLGMAMAIGHRRLADALRARVSTRMLAWAAAGFLALCALRLAANQVRVYELQFALYASAAIFAVLLALGRIERAPPPWLARLAAGLAAISYSLYLTHFTLLTFLVTQVHAGALDPAAALVLCLAGANALAIAFWWSFERHHRAVARWLRQLAGSGGAIAAPRRAP
ncbi:MAG: acyltransferase [Alphaproteobacteria bacterium]|nr:acyltransferase [Alphaproteobacteria bacterium]